MLQGEYLGMLLTIEDVDKENLAYFNYCDAGDFRLQRGKQSGLLRYPPTTACPWTRDRAYDWVSVEGKGEVHSYNEVHHAIQPAFRPYVPYMLLLVDLDTQKGQPTEHEALRARARRDLPRVQIALRIDGDLVQSLEATRRGRALAELIQHLQTLALHHCDA